LAAYADRPYKRANIHISAPHMYATVLEALELKPDLSFLNVGSGSGYLSCLVASIIGVHSVNHGIEISPLNVTHSQTCIQTWLDKYISSNPTIATTGKDHGIAIVQGNAFDIDMNSALHYDRIYVGAGCPANCKEFFFNLLSDEGILVLPINESNQMVKIQKVYGKVYTTALIR
jgi:protein-L-isoaspartate O-methyltransferase